MTVSNTSTINRLDTNGVTVDFPFTFYITETSQVKCLLVNDAGESSEYTNFTLLKAPDNNGGTLTTGDILSGVELVIYRDTPITQETDYVKGGRFPADSHEAALDKLTLQNQEQQEEIGRSLKYSLAVDPADVLNIDEFNKTIDDRDVTTLGKAIDYTNKQVFESGSFTEDAGNAIFTRRFADVDAMVAYEDLIFGARYSTGGTTWEYKGFSAGDLTDFTALTDVSVKDFGAVGDGFTDDTAAFQAACNASLYVIVPEGSYMLYDYVTLRDYHHIVVNGHIIQKNHPEIDPTVPLFHKGGFDADHKKGIVIEGSGMFSSEVMLGQSEDGFRIHQGAGYCPVIHLRACKDSIVKDIEVYKANMGVSFSIFDVASHPTWEMGSYGGDICSNVDVVGCKLHYISMFGVTLNTVRGGAIESNYCYRCGDSGIHAQFSHNIRFVNNHRESPYGDGGSYDDSLENGILTVNDAQGISIENCHHCTVSGNHVIGCATHAIDVKNNSTSILVTGNYIKDSQMCAIGVRGGDTIYGLNTAITVEANIIKNTGYLHSSHPVWVNHPYRGGIFVDDTYSCFIKDNTISGHNSTYALEPIRCEGVTLDDLGFWAAYPVEARIAYTDLVVSGNTVNFPQYRSNYPGGSPVGFEANDCALSGIFVKGIWGKVQVVGNSLLGNKFADGRWSTFNSIAGISVFPNGGEVAGEASCQSIEISDNTIFGWNGGGVYVNGELNTVDPNTTVDISSNTISELPGYGIYVKQCQTQSITGNTINAVGKVANSVQRNGIYLDGCVWGVVSGNTIRAREGNGYPYAIFSEGSSVSIISNMYQAGTDGDIGGTGATLGGNDQAAGVYNGSNYRLAYI